MILGLAGNELPPAAGGEGGNNCHKSSGESLDSRGGTGDCCMYFINPLGAVELQASKLSLITLQAIGVAQQPSVFQCWTVWELQVCHKLPAKLGSWKHPHRPGKEAESAAESSGKEEINVEQNTCLKDCRFLAAP